MGWSSLGGLFHGQSDWRSYGDAGEWDLKEKKLLGTLLLDSNLSYSKGAIYPTAPKWGPRTSERPQYSRVVIPVVSHYIKHRKAGMV